MNQTSLPHKQSPHTIPLPFIVTAMPFRAYRVATFTRRSQHRFSISLTFSSLPQYQPHLSPQSQILHNFLPWLEKKASSTISSSLSIANSSYGNSLFASNSIQTGDCILQVPYSVVSFLLSHHFHHFHCLLLHND